MTDRISNNTSRKSVLDPSKKFSSANSPEQEPEDAHAADIKAALEKRGLTLAKISRDAGYSSTAAGRALRTPWPALEEVIAEALDLEPKQIWPSRYDISGIPKKYLPRRKNGRSGASVDPNAPKERSDDEGV
jgi:Ner family transcriptional regulator